MAASNAEQERTKKRLALAITDFLQNSLTDGTLQEDDRESIEVATSCIADAFKVDPTDKAAVSDALGPDQDLLKIYGLYEKLKEKTASSAAGPSASAGANAAGSGAKDAEAEKLKGLGNVAMQRKDYKEAIENYTKAITISPTNPIYLSNRAAAYSATQQHELAKQDAELATASDPSYTKAWSRLGLARFALGDTRGSMEAYKAGIDAEGSGGSDAMKKGYETAKRKLEQEGEADAADGATGARGAGGPPGGMPDLSSIASMLGGGAGGAGGGGMPNLGDLMNNPMMRQMAQNLMSNPDMMQNLMNNPRLREMANSFGGAGGPGGAGGAGGAGGGMPDMSSLMNDPSIAEMARNLMGGGAPGAGPGPGRGAGPAP